MTDGLRAVYTAVDAVVVSLLIVEKGDCSRVTLNSDTLVELLNKAYRGRNNEDRILGTSASYVCRGPCFTSL